MWTCEEQEMIIINKELIGIKLVKIKNNNN